MAMKRCPDCGERYSDTYKSCPFCEEDEYEEEEQQEIVRRPILREGIRGSGRRGRSAYGIITPILILLIVLMATLLIYLLYGDKIAEKFAKNPPDDSDKPGVTTPVEPPSGGTSVIDPDNTEPGDTGPEDEEPGGTSGEGSMPEGTGGETAPGQDTGMSYASVAALPSGLTLNSQDFTRPVSSGPYQLKVSGGTGTYTWVSENPAIATVASDGTVTPVANGVTNIAVTDGSKKAICIVRVTGGSAPASGGGATAAPSTTTPPTTDTPSSGGSLKAGAAVVINGGNGVRVRSGPGTNYDILATVPNGGSVRITSDAGNGWYAITFTASGGVTTSGYMKGEFLANS